MGYQSTTQLTSGDLELSDVQKKRLLFIISWLHSVWFYKKWCDLSVLGHCLVVSSIFKKKTNFSLFFLINAFLIKQY